MYSKYCTVSNSSLKLPLFWQAELWPTVRIAGADLNGSDLTLPANWTDDGRGLVTETPIERSPLAAGIHRIHVSLNGQQYNDEMFLDSSVSSPIGCRL